MVQGDERGHAMGQAAVDHTVVERNAFLANCADAIGNDARPGD